MLVVVALIDRSIILSDIYESKAIFCNGNYFFLFLQKFLVSVADLTGNNLTNRSDNFL